LGTHLAAATTIPYGAIPHFPRASAPSHAGQLHVGELGGRTVLIFQGRFHAYEGYSLLQVTFPVRLLTALGVQVLILTNAAGGLQPVFRSGDLMLIRDHINLLGDNPLVGENIEAWGPRFPDMSRVYDRQLADLAVQTALEGGIRLREGVYVAVKGPSLETPAETRMLRLLGADAVGMSTVAEAIAGVHAGLRLLGLSVISNVNLPDAMAPVAIEEIIKVVQQAEEPLARLLRGIVAKLPL
jgi:purine-nucleoside phosphorylase